MSNLTISLDSDLLEAGRKYAQKNNTTLNNLLRKLLKQTVEKNSEKWLDECFKLMDNAHGDSEGRKWKREDLYNA